jgi:hypothetical protein
MISVKTSFRTELKQYNVREYFLTVLIMTPFLIMLLISVLLILPLSNKFAQWLLEENHPVELLTFLISFWAAVLGFRFVKRIKGKDSMVIVVFYLCFSSFMLFLAMEEVSWGQQFFKFDTPEFWKVRNAQGELTFHNYAFAGVNYLELYPLAFGIAGLIGIWVNLTCKIPQIICPPLILWSWFTVIFIHSGIDFSHEFYILNPAFDELINHLDEAAEMLVAISCFLYIWLNERRFSYAF